MVSKVGLALKFLLATSPVLRQLEKVNHPLLAFVFHLPEWGSTYAGPGHATLAQQYFWKKPHETNKEFTPKRALKSSHIWWDVVLERQNNGLR